jgi:hypothetical protein
MSWILDLRLAVFFARGHVGLVDLLRLTAAKGELVIPRPRLCFRL